MLRRVRSEIVHSRNFFFFFLARDVDIDASKRCHGRQGLARIHIVSLPPARVVRTRERLPSYLRSAHVPRWYPPNEPPWILGPRPLPHHPILQRRRGEELGVVPRPRLPRCGAPTTYAGGGRRRGAGDARGRSPRGQVASGTSGWPGPPGRVSPLPVQRVPGSCKVGFRKGLRSTWPSTGSSSTAFNACIWVDRVAVIAGNTHSRPTVSLSLTLPFYRLECSVLRFRPSSPYLSNAFSSTPAGSDLLGLAVPAFGTCSDPPSFSFLSMFL